MDTSYIYLIFCRFYFLLPVCVPAYKVPSEKISTIKGKTLHPRGANLFLLVKMASCKSALNSPVVCSTDRSKAVVPVLVLLFVALWFILRGDLLYVFPCVILFLCFSVLLVLRLPRLGK